MTYTIVAGCKLIGTSEDPKPIGLGYLNFRFQETDTGDLYVSDGYTWFQIASNSSKVESLTNKSIDAETSTFLNLAYYHAFMMGYKRVGANIPGASGGSIGCLAGMNEGLGAGENLTAGSDSTEGGHSVYEGNLTGETMGRFSTTAQNCMKTRRAYNPYFKVRCSLNSIAGTRLVIGYTSATTLPNSNTLLANGDSGVLVGYHGTTPNFSIFSNDGTGAMVITPLTVVKDSLFHTWEIIMTSSDVTIKLDGGNTTVLDTRIPDLTTDINLNYGGHYI